MVFAFHNRCFKAVFCWMIAVLASVGFSVVYADNVRLFNSKQGVCSRVRGFYEDSRHNIWVTTSNGICRYDGNKMHVYRRIATDPYSLAYNITLSVCEYDKDHILVATKEGLQSYNYATDDFTRVPIISIGGDTISIHISQLLRRSNGDIVASVAGYGSLCVRKENGKLVGRQVADYVASSPTTYPHLFFEDSKQRLWIIDKGNNLFLFNKSQKSQVNTETQGKLVDICETPSGNIYLATENDGLYCYDAIDKTFHLAARNDLLTHVIRIRAWRDDRLFVCTDGYGLQVYNESDNTVSHDLMQMSGIDLNHANIKDAYSDSYGNVWIGIYWKGVLKKADNRHSIFQSVGHSTLYRNTIGHASVTAILPSSMDNKSLWVAIDNSGLYSMYYDGTRGEHVSPEPTTINAMFLDNRHTLWMGSYMDGLFSFNEHTGKTTRSHHNIKHIVDIDSADNDCLWIGSIGEGFYHYDTKSDVLIQYHMDNGSIPNQDILKPNRFVNCIRQIGKTLYVGTSDGIEIYAVRDSGITPIHKRLLSFHDINDIKFDSQHNLLWIATNAGLCSLDGNSYEIREFTESDGLPNDMVSSIELCDNYVVIGTDNGMARLNVETNLFDVYYEEDGLQNNEFSIRSSCRAFGMLYFGGNDGLTYFNPDMLNVEKQVDKFDIILTDLYVDNRVVHKQHDGKKQIVTCEINKADTIFLPYDFFNVSLEMASPSILDGYVTYQYRLDQKKEWIIVDGHTNFIQLTGLSYGSHHLLIRAQTSISHSNERELIIIVRHPWYLTWWAVIMYIVLFMALCALTYVMYRYYRNSQKLLHSYQSIKEHHRTVLNNMKESLQAYKRKFTRESATERLQSQESLHPTCSPEQLLLEKMMQVIEQNLSNSDFTIDDFATQMGMSRAVFFKKVKELTAQSPNDYMKFVRLQKAAIMLKNGSTNITDVAYATGFKYSSTFSIAFKNLYGVSPSEWKAKCEEETEDNTQKRDT